MPEYLSHEEIDRRIDEQERELDQITMAQEALMHQRQAQRPSLWGRLKAWLSQGGVASPPR